MKIKYGGRQKGTPNKITKEVRERIQDIINTELESIDNLLAELTAKERLDIIIKLLPYVVAKQVETSQDPEVKTPIDGEAYLRMIERQFKTMIEEAQE
jgi:hypothetical protein